MIAASAWSGPAELIVAVQATLAGCRLAGPATVQQRWRFEAPPINVAGQAREGGTRAPLPRLQLLVGDRLVTTDADGRFALRNVAPGPTPIRVLDPSWRPPGELLLEVTQDRRLEVELWLVPEGPRDELVARYTGQGAGAQLHTVELSEAMGIPGTLGDPLRLLAASPGLSRTPFDAGWLLVRGGDPDDTGLFLDGVRVPLIYHLGGFTSVLHPEMIEALRFWPGVFPARYGDAISGAVDLVPSRVGGRSRAVGGFNLVFAHAFAETPTPWGGIAVAARRSYLDGILAAVLSPEAAGIAPRFWDVQARASIGEGSVTLLGLSDAIDAPSFSGDGVLQLAQRAIQLQATVPLGPIVTARPWLAWNRHDVTGDVIPQSIAELYPGLRLEGLGPLSEHAQLSTGLEVQRRHFTLQREEQSRASPIWTVEPYAGLSTHTPVTLWSEARLHAVAIPDQPPRSALSPRGGLRWTPSPWLQLHAAMGQLHQLPLTTLLLATPDGRYLALESSEQLEVGGLLGDRRAQLQLDGYVRRGHQLGEIELDGSVDGGESQTWGLEATGSAHRDALDLTALYQLMRADRSEDPGTRGETWLFEQPHRVELRIVQGLPRGWTLGARFRYSSGFPRLPIEGQPTPDLAYDLLLQRTVQLNLDADQDRLAPFHGLDLRIARRLVLRTWQLTASLDIQNVYNRRVVEPVITGFGEARPSYGFGLPVLPIFALEGTSWPGPPP